MTPFESIIETTGVRADMAALDGTGTGSASAIAAVSMSP